MRIKVKVLLNQGKLNIPIKKQVIYKKKKNLLII